MSCIQTGPKRMAGGAVVVVVVVISLLVFIAFVGILAATAIPAYQSYVLRAKVQEGREIARVYQLGVELYAQEHQAWPQSVEALPDVSPVSSENVRGVVIAGEGVIVVTYAGDRAIDGKSLALIPSVTNEGRIAWRCEGMGLEAVYLPLACRE